MCAKNTAQSLKWITRLQTDSKRTAQTRQSLHRNAKMYMKHVLPRATFSQNNVSKHFVVCHASSESLAAQTLVEIKVACLARFFLDILSKITAGADVPGGI
jgi:hypothetical protein